MGILFGVYKILRLFDDVKCSNEKRKEENTIIIQCIFAVLDGLMQLGANGKVTETKQQLEKYITESRK